MLARAISLFEFENASRTGSLFELIISDYLAYYREKNEPPRRLAVLFFPRLAHNPCLHATVLIRLALRSPRFTLGLWRTLLIAKHSIDIQRDIEIGPGLVLPHPLGIVLGWGVRIGSNVTLLHNITIGGLQRPLPHVTQMCPTIGDGVVIYTQSVLVGPILVGDGSVVGAGSFVDRDLPAGTVHKGLRATRAPSPGQKSASAVDT